MALTDTRNAEQVGYKQSLGRRQVQMIAIGTGWFLGSASRLHSTGPALVLSYAVGGGIAFLLMRALGELVLHRPTSGAFVSYAREFYGEKSHPRGFAAHGKYNGVLKVLGTTFSNERYGVGIPKGDTHLVTEVNAALRSYISDGSWNRSLERNIAPSGYSLPAPPTPGAS